MCLARRDSAVPLEGRSAGPLRVASRYHGPPADAHRLHLRQRARSRTAWDGHRSPASPSRAYASSYPGTRAAWALRLRDTVRRARRRPRLRGGRARAPSRHAERAAHGAALARARVSPRAGSVAAHPARRRAVDPRKEDLRRAPCRGEGRQSARTEPTNLAASPRRSGDDLPELLDEVRHFSARRLLAHTDLGAGEVAFLLGFEELNSFTRAFHAWEGTTPARWRASAR